MNSAKSAAIESFLSGLKWDQCWYPLGGNSPAYRFENIDAIIGLLVRLGVEGEFRFPASWDSGQELRQIRHFMCGGRWMNYQLIFCVLGALFLNSPKHLDGTLVLVIPATGAERLAQTYIKHLYEVLMARLTTDATFRFELKEEDPINRN